MPNESVPISPSDLSARLSAGDEVAVIDVRPSSDYGCSHLPNAVNHCVYEIGFREVLSESRDAPGERSDRGSGPAGDSPVLLLIVSARAGKLKRPATPDFAWPGAAFPSMMEGL